MANRRGRKPAQKVLIGTLSPWLKARQINEQERPQYRRWLIAMAKEVIRRSNGNN